MRAYELFVNELHAHPSGDTQYSRVMSFSFEGKQELLHRINQAAQNEILKWHQEQKEKNVNS